MILTVTLNASIDKLYLLDRAVPETVMRVREVHNTSGGKGLNVSRVAQKLGEPVTAMGFTGGFNGQYLESMLASTGVSPRFTHVSAETRSCINCWDLSNDRSTEYLEPGAPVSPEEVEQFLRDFDAQLPMADAVSISGSVPAGVPAGLYARLIERCKVLNKPVILDTSGKLLTESVSAGPTLVKPNEDEIGSLLGDKPCDEMSRAAALKHLNNQGIRYAVLSLGADGAMIAFDGECWHGRPPRIQPRNTVGCGDSMVAGFAVGLARNMGILDAFRMALAVSAASAMSLLTGDFSTEDYERLLPQTELKRI